jgi:hypothetical protein
MKLLNKIQKELKVGKTHTVKFGDRYKYRNCEEILEAVKPLLGDTGVLTLSDEIIECGGRIYVKATVTLTDGDDAATATANAREPEKLAAMSQPQISGTASSYARKYALGGLFCLDDADDADEKGGDGTAGPPPPSKKAEKVLKAICDKMTDSVPEGLVLVDSRVDAVLFAQQGRYPEDINKAGAVAAWLISLLTEGNSWNTVTKKAGE